METDHDDTNFTDDQTFYPQSSSWKKSKGQIQQQFEFNVGVADSSKTETKSDNTFRNSQEFLQLLSQLNQTLETLKFQEKVYKSGKESLIFSFYIFGYLKVLEIFMHLFFEKSIMIFNQRKKEI